MPGQGLVACDTCGRGYSFLLLINVRPLGYQGTDTLLLLLADDHGLVREGLKHTLADLRDDLSFLEAGSASEVLTALEANPDTALALLDLVMPGSNGFQLLTQVCDQHPELPVVILSASADPVQMRKSLDIGAAGFIPKHASAGIMLSALRLVLAGGIYVPPDMLLSPDPAPTDATNPADTDAGPDALDDLTSRQRIVLHHLGRGLSNKHIARELGLAENTVKIHVAAILRTLGVSNRTQAALVARERRMRQEIDSDEAAE